MKKERIYIRLSKEDKSILKERANSTGKSLSDFMRNIVLNQEIKFLSIEDKTLINELKKELRAATNHRNQNSHSREFVDTVRNKVKGFLNKLK